MNNEEYEYNDQQGGEEYYDNNNYDPIWVRALYDYDAADDTEISFRENDLVCITQDYEDGWWCGNLNGNIGRVPANYFEYIDQPIDQQYNTDANQQYETYYDEDGNLQYYDNTYSQQEQQQTYYDEDGNLQYYDNTYSQNQEVNTGYYDESGNYYQQEQQEQPQEQDNAQYVENSQENERKELLRQKREVFKKEMKELQDKLKGQNETNEILSNKVGELEKQRDELEDHIRVLKLLRFIKLEIIKAEIDIDVDSEASTNARQTGIAITQDLKAMRTILIGLKSSSVEVSKRRFDQKLEEIERKTITNLNLLDTCDNLKKSILLSLQIFRSTVLEPSLKQQQPPLPQKRISSPPPPVAARRSIPSPLPSTHQPVPNSTNPYNNTHLPPPPTFVPTTSTAPNAFFSSPATILLSDKDKRKSVKEAKKIEKLEKKEEKKMEKLEKKDKSKKDDFINNDNSSPLWKGKK